MTTPIWFLDVDGVVNAAGRDVPEHLLRTEAVTAGTTWPIHYSPEVVEFINMVHRNRLAEVRWLTTWSQDARTSLAPAVGLDDFFAYDMPDTNSPRGWWKSDVIADFIASDPRPFIWTDDDLQSEDTTFLVGVECDHLALCPMAVGLNDDDLTRIHGMMLSMATMKVADVTSPRRCRT